MKLTQEQQLLLAQFIAWGPTGPHVLELHDAIKKDPTLVKWSEEQLDEWVQNVDWDA